MFIQLSAYIVDSDQQNREELAQVLAGFGLTVVGQASDVATMQAALDGGEKPQVVLVNLDPDAADMLLSMQHLPRSHPQVAFFAMSQVLDPQLLMRSMSLGVREFIPLPMTEQVLKDALERLAASHGEGHRARVIQVVPSTGGCGSTTIACNVASSLAAQGYRTVLIDLDLVRGDVAGAFDVRPSYTIADVMESSDRVDQQIVENALITHDKTGLRILGRPDMIEETQRVSQTGVQKLIGLLARMNDYVVIDGVMSMDPIYSTAVAASDVTLLTMQLNVPSAKNAERYVAALRRSGIESTRIKVIVNRFVKRGWDIAPGEVERALGLDIAYTVPNDFKTAIAAINYGEPAVIRQPRAEMSLALTKISDDLVKSRASAAAGEKKSKLRRAA